MLSCTYAVSLNDGPVCGIDGITYSNAEASSTASTTIMHCGPCGACSTHHDISIYWKTKETLTDTVTTCAWLVTLIGNQVGKMCMDKTVGFTEQCDTCWRENITCTINACLPTCLKWKLFKMGDFVGMLNPCLACDEAECGTKFKECAGANRRNTGIVSDITRKEEEMCTIYDDSFINNDF